ncbi:hypothetical protein [Loktanella sp. Alg231-35]|uniref:hypothetical protein n=1 Tax=Loktanella sp. Alg231-35 TaxID=1922220 RepID=UPI000D55543D|nr:hypothetical protein [Loktanella sp. Alg231-35]
MAETYITQTHRPRRVGGALLVVIALPLTLIAARFGLPYAESFSDFWPLLGGPLLLIAGLWAAFPRHPPAVRLTITDDMMRFHALQKDIPLDTLKSITYSMPALSKHYRLGFETDEETTPLDLVHLTHEGRDIINLISVRLEKRGKHLQEGHTAIRGAKNSIWKVLDGIPFEQAPNHAKLPHGRE